MKQLTQEQQEASKERRQQFKAKVNDLVKHEKENNPLFKSSGNVNRLLIASYQAETGQTDFRTFKGWKEAGYKVTKGQRGWPIFSRPIATIKAEQGKEASEDEAGYFGTCYLFHTGQVEEVQP